ncbi:MAG: 3-deoxy-D-manno-octulosonic acid transferase, partial [Chlamydiia bacterium]|nr:3-deoxy-D-manno-octulosonic acid transferase [Chlamydiia bacterium]
MLAFLYNTALVLFALLYFPKFLYDLVFHQKYRTSLRARLFPKGPSIDKRPSIWLHGVSVGEIKALSTLIPHIKKTYPNGGIVVTTVTETGYAQAKRSFPDVSIEYLPLDFLWAVRSFARAIHPDLLILVEGDYWLNLIKEVKKLGAKVVVANGKLSKRSLKRYLSLPRFSKALFSPIDHFFLQGESHMERFLMLGISPEKLTITGNLKLDIPPPEPAEFIAPFLQKGDRIITLGSTHEGEEALLIKEIAPLLDQDPHLKLVIVPRHPQRFAKVSKLVNHPQIFVITRMGILATCYQHSTVAIIGGSFVKGIGGHDIFEPVKGGVPTLYGPHMEKQPDLDKLLEASGAAKKISPNMVGDTLRNILYNDQACQEMITKGKALVRSVSGNSLQTWMLINALLIPLASQKLE